MRLVLVEPPLRATEAGAATAYPRDAIRNAWRKKLKVGRSGVFRWAWFWFGRAPRRGMVVVPCA